MAPEKSSRVQRTIHRGSQAIEVQGFAPAGHLSMLPGVRRPPTEIQIHTATTNNDSLTARPDRDWSWGIFPCRRCRAALRWLRCAAYRRDLPATRSLIWPRVLCFTHHTILCCPDIFFFLAGEKCAAGLFSWLVFAIADLENSKIPNLGSFEVRELSLWSLQRQTVVPDLICAFWLCISWINTWLAIIWSKNNVLRQSNWAPWMGFLCAEKMMVSFNLTTVGIL